MAAAGDFDGGAFGVLVGGGGKEVVGEGVAEVFAGFVFGGGGFAVGGEGVGAEGEEGVGTLAVDEKAGEAEEVGVQRGVDHDVSFVQGDACGGVDDDGVLFVVHGLQYGGVVAFGFCGGGGEAGVHEGGGGEGEGAFDGLAIGPGEGFGFGVADVGESGFGHFVDEAFAAFPDLADVVGAGPGEAGALGGAGVAIQFVAFAGDGPRTEIVAVDTPAGGGPFLGEVGAACGVD